MTMTYEQATKQMSRARSKDAGKPVANNTRLFERADGTIAVRYHNTDIIGINEDGTFSLANNGWRTVTTLQRIRAFSPAKLFSERGDWFVRSEPNPADPYPQRYDRTIPKPFEATDPGPEPVKSDHGCIAGSSTAEPYYGLEPVYDWRPDPEPQIFITNLTFVGGSSPRRMAHVAGIERIFYGETANSWSTQDVWWMLFTGQHDKYNGNRKVIEIDGKTIEYKQCPHCAAFDNLHAAWSFAMNGGGYGQQRFLGYAKRMALIEQFGSVEGWQAAYIEDFRARRAYLKVAKEWEQRNRVVFYDGIIVNEDGYAIKLRADGPSPAKLRRHEAKVNKIKRDIDKFIDGYIEQLRKGMPMPSNGDCWYCTMFHAVPANEQGMRSLPRGHTVTPLAERGENDDHLFSHMKERYYVPTLAVNAMRERGYQDAGIYFMLDMDPIRTGDTKMIGTGKMGGKNNYDNVKRDMRTYLRKRLLPTPPTS
jgi:hypothetical protein